MVHPTSATNIIQRLEGQGLVERAPNPADGRGTLAAITPSGREVMEQATRDLVDRGFSLTALEPGRARAAVPAAAQGPPRRGRLLRVTAGSAERPARVSPGRPVVTTTRTSK